MKILIVTQYFWPEDFRINDLAIGLKQKGHNVLVLTGIPNYPQGKFFSGYKALCPLKETFEGIPVFRVPIISRGSGSRIRLAINYVSFLISGIVFAPLHRMGKIDLIFVYEPSPITVSLPAIFLKAVKSAPIYLWIQDLWPESVSAAGSITSKWVLEPVKWMVRFVYRNCDFLLMQSRAFKDSIEELGGNSNRLRYFPNSAEKLYRKVKVDKDAPERKLFPKGFCITFAGNIGAAQDFNTILNAAEMVKDKKDLHFIIIGDGRKKLWVEEEIKKRNLNETVHLLGRHPVETMPIFFSLSDALLVTLKKDPIFELTIPSKVQSYLACGKPIIAALDGEGAKIVQESGGGITCQAENPMALANAAVCMAKKDADELNEMGERGLAYFNNHFERDKLLDRLNSWLTQEI